MTDKYPSTYTKKLEKCIELGSRGDIIIDEKSKNWSDVIIKNSGNATAVLAVVITSILKKSLYPSQDIRLHQEGMEKGYSGRVLDTKIVTPFLKINNFPSMRSGSGWLTRSLEQALPYNLQYPGRISPKEVKDAFLNIIDTIQNERVDPDLVLTYFMQELIKRRERERIELTLPKDQRIDDVIRMLDMHFRANYGKHGASRLPVLAIYSLYEQIILQINRYKGCTLKSMESHTAADQKTGAVGDIEVFKDGVLFEALEIKHGQMISLNMIGDAFEKFRSCEIRRYYLLTTHEEHECTDTILKKIKEISKTNGCQVIVNGVIDTLRYYLRLLDSPTTFLNGYLKQMSLDPTILYDHKIKWNEIAAETGNNK